MNELIIINNAITLICNKSLAVYYAMIMLHRSSGNPSLNSKSKRKISFNICADTKLGR